MEKGEARLVYKEIRKNMADEIREKKNRQIRENLFASKVFKQFSNLYTYFSYGTEADTTEIIKKSLGMGKRVFLPKTYSGRKMEFFEIFSLEELVSGFHGILEPDTKKNPGKKPFQETGLMLVPGLAFEMGGCRLGYGGGYYDAYFSLFPKEHFYKLGLCFQSQVLETPIWPLEKQDIPVDGILTEQGLIYRESPKKKIIIK